MQRLWWQYAHHRRKQEIPNIKFHTILPIEAMCWTHALYMCPKSKILLQENSVL